MSDTPPSSVPPGDREVSDAGVPRVDPRPTSPRRLSRRQFLVGGGAGVAAAAAGVHGFALEPGRLTVSHERIGSPERGPSVRLAILTDLHLKRVSSFHERLAAAVSEANPDAVVIVGDAIDDRDHLPLLRDFLALLPERGTRIATLGNWEYWSQVDVRALARTYEQAETRLLVNQSYTLADGQILYATDDSLAGHPNLDELNEIDDGEVVLLSHCPAFRDALSGVDTSRVRAMISGHTHGGQISLAGWAPIRPPGSGRYTAGWYRGDGVPLYVSRGLGTSVLPVRFGSPPELVVMEWFPGRS